jgi:hypothetical protein
MPPNGDDSALPLSMVGISVSKCPKLTARGVRIRPSFVEAGLSLLVEGMLASPGFPAGEQSRPNEQHGKALAQTSIAEEGGQPLPADRANGPSRSSGGTRGRLEKGQWPKATSATRPFTAIRSRLVPLARAIGRPANSTRAGTMAKPPPTPAIPVSNPTASPCKDRLMGAGRLDAMALREPLHSGGVVVG